MASIGMDRYDRGARLAPALLSLLPPLALVAVRFPGHLLFPSTAWGLVTVFGLATYLVHEARIRGRRVEEALGDRIGRAHTARLISHADRRLPWQTKQQVHDYISAHSPVTISSAEHERADPVIAQETYRSAVDWLLEYTRPNAGDSLLHEENIAYGFRRNLLGLKPIGLTVCGATLVLNSVLMVTSNAPYPPLAVELVLEGALVLACAAWQLRVNPAFVEDASTSYAQRLLAQCHTSRGLAASR